MGQGIKELSVKNSQNMKLWIFVLALVFLLLLGVSFLFGTIMENGKSQAVAEWFGAFGTILAIGGAYALGDKQAKWAYDQAVYMRSEELRDRRSSLKAILDHVFLLCLRAEKIVSGDGPLGNVAFWDMNSAVINERVDLLDKMPLFDLDSGELVAGVLGLQRAVRSLSKMVTMLENLRAGSLSFSVSEDEIKKFLRTDVYTAREAYMRCIAVTGGTAIILPPQGLLEALIQSKG